MNEYDLLLQQAFSGNQKKEEAPTAPIQQPKGNPNDLLMQQAFGTPVTSTPTRQPTEQGRLSQAFEQGEMAAILRGQEFNRDLSAALEEGVLGRTFYNARQRLGLDTDTPQVRADEIRNTELSSTGQAAQRRLDQFAQQGFNIMSVSDIEGIRDILPYIGENLASSLPQMGATLASGPLVGPMSFALLSSEANEELKEKLPELDEVRRVEIASGAGFAMAALDLVGLSKVTSNLLPGEFARQAVRGELVDTLITRGIPRRAAKILEAAVVEGTTEAMQEGIVVGVTAASGGEYTSEEVKDRLINAFAGGAGAGGAVRAATGLVTGEAKEPNEIVDAEQLTEFTDEDLGTDDTPTAPERSTENRYDDPESTLVIPGDTGQEGDTADGAETASLGEPSGVEPEVQSEVQSAPPVRMSDISDPRFELDDDLLDATFEQIPFDDGSDLSPIPNTVVPQESILGSSVESDKNQGWFYLGPKKGSADGGLYYNQFSGQNYVVKKYKNPAQVGNEQAVNELFTQFKTDLTSAINPETSENNIDGNIVFSSQALEGYVPFDPNDLQQMGVARNTWAFNAWVANWDVFGQDYDNVLWNPDTESLAYVDFGGSLLFRAMGGEKGLAFGKVVTETNTFFDPKINPQTAKVYDGLSRAAQEIQVKSLVNKFGYNLEIEKALDPVMSLTPLQKEKIRIRLYQRLRYLATKYGIDYDLDPNFEADYFANSQEALKSKTGQLEPMVEVGPTGSPTLAADVNKIEDQAEFFASFNEKFVYSYKNATNSAKDVVSTILNDPQVMSLLTNKNFAKWQEGNKLYWSADNHSLFYHVNKEGKSPWELYKDGLLPGILFHGSNHFKFEFDPLTGVYHAYDMYDMKKQSEGQGGGDTHLGMFLSENPLIAAQYGWAAKFYSANGTGRAAELTDLKSITKGNILPLVVNLNPYPVDFGGKDWDSSLTSTYSSQAKKLGYNSLLMHNMTDKGGKQTQVVVFEPDQTKLKSPFALAFDDTVASYKAKVAGEETTLHTLTKADADGLKKILKQYGLEGVVQLGFMENPKYAGLTGQDANGLFILLNKAMEGSKATLHHEAIHVLEILGFFNTPKGKRYMSVLKAKVKKQGISQTVRNSYPKEQWVEEEIARLVEVWYNGTLEETGVVKQALDAIKNFIEALGNWARGRGFITVNGIFEDLTSTDPVMRDWVLGASDQFMQNFDIGIKKSIIAAKKVGVKVDEDFYGTGPFATGKVVKHGWTIIQLAKKNLHIPWLQEYTQLASQWHTAKTKWLAKANETVGKWNSLTYDQQEKLAKTLFDVEQMIYRSQDEIDRGVVRKPTKQELIGIFKANKLGREGAKMYVQIRADFDAVLNKIEEVSIQSIERELGADSLAAQLEIAKAKNEFSKLRKAPYFPHARFGQYTIIVKDADGKTVYAEMFENEKARDKAFIGVKKKFPNDVVSKSKLSEESQVYRGIPHALLIAMKQNLKLDTKQMAALEEMIVHSMPAISFKNHFVKKENIEGYSRDALRAYADYFWHAANHLARIEYGPLMEDAQLDGDQNIKEMIQTGADSTNRVKILDHVKSHYEAIMNPKEDWAALRSAGFLWWLGFNVKSAVLNFTQVPMVTQAHLAAHFGDARSAVAMTKVMGKLKSLYRSPEKAVNAEDELNLKMVARGIEEGFLDESFAAELAGFAEGNNLVQGVSKTKVNQSIIWFNHKAGYLFQAMEKINRRVSFMAAVELARQKPNAKYLVEVRTRYNLEYTKLLQDGYTQLEATAFLAGKDTVESTQFNYSAWSRPKLMEGRKSAIFTFFMFTQNMLWFIQNSPGSTRYLLALLMFGGLMGMPGAEDMEEIAEATAKVAFGKEFSLQKELREILTEIMGEDGPPPDLFLHGMSRYGFGLPLLGDMTGLPLPSVDMSANIGMGSPLPIVSPAIQALGGMAKQRDFDEVLGEFTAEGVGATLSIPINVVKAIFDSQMEFTDPKRWEKAMPAALSAVSKAVRYYRDGAETTRTGAEIIPFDKNDPIHFAEIVAQSLGFNPTRKSQTWDRLIMAREAANFWAIRRSTILRQWDHAKKSGDKSEIAAMKKAVNRFNQTVPYRDLKLTHKTLSRSYKQRELGRAKEEAFEPRSKMMEGIYKDIQRLHPELEINEAWEDLPSGN